MSAPASGATPAGSRPVAQTYRFWLVVFLFAILNLTVWIVYHRMHAPQRMDLLALEGFRPGEGAVITEPRPTLAWTFNLDVLAPAEPAVILPRLAGEWKWSDARTVTFTPREELPRATRWTVTMPPERFKTREGFSLAAPAVTTFQTPGLRWTALRQSGFADDGTVVLELEFSEKVLPGDVLRQLTVQAGGGSAATGVRLLGDPGATRVVRVQVPLAAAVRHTRDINVQASLAAGLMPAGGTLGLGHGQSRTVNVANHLVLTEASADAPTEGQPSLRLRFNNEVGVDQLEGLVSVEPAVPFSLQRSWDGVQLVGDFAPATRYAVKISQAPVDDGKKYPRPAALSVMVPDRRPACWFEHRQGYLGSAGNRTLLVKAVNVAGVTAAVERVYDNNMAVWRNLRADYDDVSEIAKPLGKRTYKLDNVRNKVEEIRISLDDLLPKNEQADGAYRIGLTYTASPNPREGGVEPEESYSYNSHASALVTVSDIGLTAKRTHEGVVVWAVSLSTAKPLSGVRVRGFSSRNQPAGEATTDDEGLARFAVAPMPAGEELSVLLADRAGSDQTRTSLTWLDLSRGGRNMASFDTSGRSYLRKGYEAFLYTDRGVYRPGETVVLRAIVRGEELKTPDAFPVKWQMRRPDNRNYRSNVVTLDKDGAAEWRVELPADLPTGRWSTTLSVPGDATVFGTAAFHVEEFLPDRMKVAMTLSGAVEEKRVRLADKPLLADVQADYLFGQPAAGLKATLNVSLQPAVFAPREWTGWTFGDAANAGKVFGAPAKTGRRLEEPDVELDEEGHTQFEVALSKAEMAPGERELQAATKAAPVVVSPEAEARLAGAAKFAFRGPWQVTASCSVIETGGRAVSANETLPGDELPYYVGVRPSRTDAPVGQPWKVDVAAVVPGGAAADAAREITLRVYREEWNNVLARDGHRRQGSLQYVTTRVLTPVTGMEKTVSLAGGKGSAALTLPTSGAYVLEAHDASTNQATTVWFYASQGGGWDDNVSRENPDRLELAVLPTSENAGDTPRTKFRSGETVKAVIRSPFAGRLLLTVETDEVVASKVIEMTSPLAEVPLEIPAEARPNAYVSATVVRAVDANAKWRTHRAFGTQRIALDDADKRLAVVIEAPEEMRPSGTLDLTIKVTDAGGNAVAGAAVAVAAVDEGICRITRFVTPDPLAFFMGRRALGVACADLYGDLMPEVARAVGQSDIGGDGGSEGEVGGDSRHLSVVRAKRVRPVALVAQTVHTDAEGNAKVHLQVPQFLGQLRVMAVSHAGDRMGSGEQPVLVRSPVVVQSSFPRFAAPGDSFDVPLVVFNNSQATGEAKIRLTLAGADGQPSPLAIATGGESAEVPLTVKAGEQAAATLRLTAAARSGVARIRLMATLGADSFEEEVELPVRPAAPLMTRGEYVVATPDQPLRLTLPTDVVPGTEQLDIRITPRPLLNLPGGLGYLNQYPYGCLEQTTSKCFALVNLSDLGEHVGVDNKERVAQKVQVGITRLLSMMAPDGGLAMWPGDRATWPWGTVYAAHFLVAADGAGHTVPEDLKARVLDYCRGVLTKAPEASDSIETQAYAAYVLALAGKPSRAAMNRLGDVLDAAAKAPATDGSHAPAAVNSARFYLSAAWVAAGRKDLAGGLLPEVLPQPRTERQLLGNVGSGVRDRALMLSTILSVRPDHPSAAGLAESLAQSGRRREWYSTQDTAWAVMALGQYIRATKGDVAYESVELWSQGQKVAGSDKDRRLVWSSLPKARDAAFEVRVKGEKAAKAHVTWGHTGVPLAAPQDADHAMKIRRQYQSESGKPLEKLEVTTGTLVRVNVTIESSQRLDYLVVEDLLPAGLEIENQRLESAAKDAGSGRDGTTPATLTPHRTDIRDDRLVAVFMAPGGKLEYSYLARAVTPGTYTVPPVRGECMYDIGINSISGASGTFTVTPAGKKAVAAK